MHPPHRKDEFYSSALVPDDHIYVLWFTLPNGSEGLAEQTGSGRGWRRCCPSRAAPAGDHSRVISGINPVLKSSGRCADAPSSYGLRKTLYNRFVRWAAKGVWSELFEVLAAAVGYWLSGA